MAEIFISKQQINEVLRRDFLMEHHASPKKIQVARAIVNGNLDIISHFTANGLFTHKQFERILNDKKLQMEYAKMAIFLEKGKYTEFDRLYTDIKDRPDTLCGWLDFENYHLETTLNLLPKEESY
jgi:FKBP-type peptidyl-prolyl cis-trans isomerase (trigger factor)